MWLTFHDWWRSQQRKLERPGSPDEIVVKRFTNNFGEVRYLVEGTRLGVHLGDKPFVRREDAVAHAKMLAGWHAAKLVDRSAGR